MAYNYGRPILIDEALIFPHLHSLLKHPAHLPTDSRIVAFCELLYLRREFPSPIMGGWESLLTISWVTSNIAQKYHIWYSPRIGSTFANLQ